MTSGPDWLPGRTWYHLHALRASGAPDVGSDPGNGDGFHRLTAWLDHLAELGCGGVLLTPVFTATTHGYDTVDPFQIDPRLGDEDDLLAFVAAAHARDLKVALDGVFHHVGRAFPRFQEVLAGGKASPSAAWFRLDFTGDEGDGFSYRTFEGDRELVVLNHQNSEVLEWAIAVGRHWLDRGVDGWRFDVGYAIPAEFLAAVTSALREAHPQAFLLGEMIHGDYGAFADRAGLDSVTQYELHKAIWSSLNDGNLFELAWALDRHRGYSTSMVPFTFVGNHDVTRLMSHLHDPAHLGPALAVLFTVPGTPAVYYGDEFGWTGRKEDRPGGDDEIRPRLPASPFAVDAAQSAAFDRHRELIAFRREHAWLTHADTEVVDLANRHMTYRVSHRDRTVTVTLDLDRGGPGFSIDG